MGDINILSIVQAMHAVMTAFEAVQDVADDIAELLDAQGQPALKEKLAELRAENDAARLRRHEKLKEAATR